MRILFWFRKDLRLDDNTGLAAAARDAGGDVVPFYASEPAILSRPDIAPIRVRFVLDALADLAAACERAGSRLALAHGDATATVLAAARACGADAVWWNDEYEPELLARDAAVETRVARGGPGRRTLPRSPARAARRGADAGRHALHRLLALSPRLRGVADAAALAAPGGHAARARTTCPRRPWRRSSDWDSRRRRRPRSRRGPAGPPPRGGASRRSSSTAWCAMPASATSRPSPRTRGCRPTSSSGPSARGASRTPRSARSRAARPGGDPALRSSVDKFVAELRWRDFYAQVLFHFPHAATGAFRREFDAIHWEGDPAWFEAWKAGRTGYPIVDAAMRELAATGFMHNRTRMIVASFLTKDLLLDWRAGERWFMQHLVDGDLASNNGGWQWAAGTGTDAQPYFRIFNPVLQGARFDPDGTYVKRWVPELAAVPAEKIHVPWEIGVKRRRGSAPALFAEAGPPAAYPGRIVLHEEMRERALAMYRASG